MQVDSGHLADMAQYIADQCYEYIPRVGGFVGGQLFSSDGYNVGLYDDTCWPFPRTMKREVFNIFLF
jgi:hypothetical protein